MVHSLPHRHHQEPHGVIASLNELVHEGTRAHSATLHLRRKIDALGGGSKRSSIRGRGMEFFESRPYVPQDELRTIDWKVSARLNSLYTKVFIEEKNRPYVFALDLRPHMFFGTKNCFKSVLVARIAARLSAAAINGNDHVGGLIFTGQKVLHCPQGARRKDVNRFLGMVADATKRPAEGMVDNFWHGLFTRLYSHVQRGATIVLLSDLFDFDERVRPLLMRLLRRADFFVVRVSDPLDDELPAIGQVGMQYNHQTVSFNSNDIMTAQAYKNWREKMVVAQKEILRGLHIPTFTCSTKDDLDSALNPLFSGKW